MKALSLCSGVGMLDSAATLAGIEVVAQVEIDADCRRVLHKQRPDMRVFTDMKQAYPIFALIVQLDELVGRE